MKPIRVGTDCSGIEAPIEALRQLRIPYSHEWSCEIDKYATKSILANYNSKRLYTDITKRNHKLLPDIDLYVCGFPCQPFSLLGNKKGSIDPRSNIMIHCIKVIKTKMPAIFILENVISFMNLEEGRSYRYLISKLNAINQYNISVDILNTADYGIPQHRKRMFIIGIRKDIQKVAYHTPQTVPLTDLDSFLIDKTIHKVKPKKNAQKVIDKHEIDMRQNNVIACAGYGNYMTNMTPTLTCSTPMYLTKYKRYLLAKECLLLQGFSNDFKTVVSDTQLYKQCGNSMSVNVLKAIYQVIKPNFY